VTIQSPYAARPWLRHYDYWVRPHLNYPGRPLSDILDAAAIELPDRPATWFLGAQLTFLDLKRRSDALAVALAGLGIAQGDRVGIMLPNCPQHHRGVRHPAARRRSGQRQPELHGARGSDVTVIGSADDDHARRDRAARARRPRADGDRANYCHLVGRIFSGCSSSAAHRWHLPLADLLDGQTWVGPGQTGVGPCPPNANRAG
jgi:hypothetical protein